MPFIKQTDLDRLDAYDHNLKSLINILTLAGLVDITTVTTDGFEHVDLNKLRSAILSQERRAFDVRDAAVDKARREALELVIEALRLDDYRTSTRFNEPRITDKYIDNFEADLKTALRVREEQKQRDADAKVEEKVAGLVIRSSLPVHKVFIGPAQPVDQPFKIEFNPEAPTVAGLNNLFGVSGVTLADGAGHKTYAKFGETHVTEDALTGESRRVSVTADEHNCSRCGLPEKVCTIDKPAPASKAQRRQALLERVEGLLYEEFAAADVEDVIRDLEARTAARDKDYAANPPKPKAKKSGKKGGE